MKQLPLISIVVPSYNQGKYLAETLQSLVAQAYPRLQVIIQDGFSSDDSVAIAESFTRRHPEVFQLFVEKDAGQADAINRGFARASGTILGFLNSDDVLHPRVLHRVADEIDPARDRYVVMGRSIFTGENSRYVGVEHPAEYLSHFEHLAIWKRGFNTVPQPSVFWHRSVTERVGWLDVNEHHALDYDLFSRFSKYYHFHRIDQLFSDYRMHDESKSAQRTEAEVLALSIEVSRKHWGPWYSPLRWRLMLSHRAYAHQHHDHARHHARLAEAAFRERHLGAAAMHFLNTAFFSPRMAKDRLLYGWLAGRQVSVLTRLVGRDSSFRGQHADGWIGPSFQLQLSVPPHAAELVVEMEHWPQTGHDQFEVRLLIDGKATDSRVVQGQCQFRLTAPLAGMDGGMIAMDIQSASHFVPREVMEVPDDRQLSLKMLRHVFLDTMDTNDKGRVE